MKTIYPIIALAVLSACQATTSGNVTRSTSEPLRTRMEGPPNSDPDDCWGRVTTPAVIETVTNQILLQPAQIGSDGQIRSMAVYKTETSQQIVKERQDLWFETICATEQTPEFISSVQRALQVRGVYRGPINGQMTSRTLRAIRAYQTPQGLESSILARAAARKLGLIEYGRPLPEDAPLIEG